MMRIGIDITGLFVAKAGIYYYTLHLLEQLLSLQKEHKYVLVDFTPLHAEMPLPLDLQTLTSQYVEVVRIKGPRQRKLIEWSGVDFFGGRFTAQCIDAVLDRPWRWLIENTTSSQVESLINTLDVIHVSDVTRPKPAKSNPVITVHDISPILFPQFHTRQNRSLFKRKMHYILRYKPTIIAVSQHTRRDLIEKLAIPEERIRVVYNGVGANYRPISDVRIITQTVRKYGLPDSEYILHVGTLEPRKNLVRLLQAYEMVVRQCNQAVPPLVLAGGKGWKYQQILRAIRDLNLESRVYLTGFVADEDLPALFNGALVFIYPSLYEGFGLPVLEGMACGVPVITSNVSSLPEVVGKAGLLVDPTDTQAIVSALVTMLKDAALRTQLRSAGLAQASPFSWDRTARETVAVYEEQRSGLA